MLTGHLQPHGILAILFAIINLKPSLRMSLPALQVAALCYDHEAKAAGMVDVFNGGETSPGAQLKRFQHPHPVTVRCPGGGYEKREMTIHAPLFAGDYPAVASMTPCKGSTSAHRCAHCRYPCLQLHQVQMSTSTPAVCHQASPLPSLTPPLTITIQVRSPF